VLDWRHEAGETAPARRRAQSLSQRPARWGVGDPRATRARRQAGWTPRAPCSARDRQCHLVRGARGEPMAGHAARPATVADRLLLFSDLAQRRDVGAHPHGVARAHAATAGTRGDPQRSDCGQSNGQDQSKGGVRGYDAHKQVKGRKRHLLVDTQGLLLKVVVSAADVQDRDGARLLAHAVRLYGPHLPRLSLVWADAAYGGSWWRTFASTWAGRSRWSNGPTPSPVAPLPCSRTVGSWNGPSAGSAVSAACQRITNIRSSRARRSFMPP